MKKKKILIFFMNLNFFFLLNDKEFLQNEQLLEL
jgi:hypothetical protein